MKKGALEIQYVILLILGLLVLLALVIIFHTQISQFASQLTSVAHELNESRPPINSIVK